MKNILISIFCALFGYGAIKTSYRVGQQIVYYDMNDCVDEGKSKFGSDLVRCIYNKKHLREK